MNKYILPLIIVIGLVIIIVFPQITKKQDENKNLTSTTVTKTETISSSPTATSSSVPLLKEEDVIETFFNLINEKKIPDAINMMSLEMIGSESEKQSWGVHFNNIDKIIVKKISPSLEEDWTESKRTYKVLLDVKMNPNSSNAPIAYYGWDNGENIRFVEIKKINEVWKIASLNTGP